MDCRPIWRANLAIKTLQSVWTPSVVWLILIPVSFTPPKKNQRNSGKKKPLHPQQKKRPYILPKSMENPMYSHFFRDVCPFSWGFHLCFLRNGKPSWVRVQIWVFEWRRIWHANPTIINGNVSELFFCWARPSKKDFQPRCWHHHRKWWYYLQPTLPLLSATKSLCRLSTSVDSHPGSWSESYGKLQANWIAGYDMITTL